MQTLRAFEAAVRHHSYSGAARELGLTHGAISHRIRALEDQIGAPLFQRSGREMVPTRSAVSLAARVSEGLQILSEALPFNAAGGDGRVVIGVHHSLAISWLIPRLKHLHEEHPGISVEVYSTAELGDFLGSRVDLAIRYGGGNWAGVSAQMLSATRLFPVCSPDYQQDKALTKPRDLKRCRLLRHSWHAWMPWLAAARVKMREPSDGLLMSDSTMLIEAAARGLGVALVGELFATDGLAAGRLVKPFDLSIADDNAFYLLWHTGARLSPEAQILRDWLRRQFGD